MLGPNGASEKLQSFLYYRDCASSPLCLFKIVRGIHYDYTSPKFTKGKDWDFSYIYHKRHLIFAKLTARKNIHLAVLEINSMSNKASSVKQLETLIKSELT